MECSNTRMVTDVHAGPKKPFKTTSFARFAQCFSPFKIARRGWGGQIVACTQRRRSHNAQRAARRGPSPEGAPQ